MSSMTKFGESFERLRKAERLVISKDPPVGSSECTQQELELEEQRKVKEFYLVEMNYHEMNCHANDVPLSPPFIAHLVTYCSPTTSTSIF